MSPPLALPASAFSSNAPEVQTHYNNPDLDEGLQDNSGVRVYYTEEPRAMDAGILQLGDPFLMLEDMEIPDGKSKFAFECPQSCLEENFEVCERDS